MCSRSVRSAYLLPSIHPTPSAGESVGSTLTLPAVCSAYLFPSIPSPAGESVGPTLTLPAVRSVYLLSSSHPKQGRVSAQHRQSLRYALRTCSLPSAGESVGSTLTLPAVCSAYLLPSPHPTPSAGESVGPLTLPAVRSAYLLPFTHPTPSARENVGSTLTPPAVCIAYLLPFHPYITHRHSPTFASPLATEIPTRSPFVGSAHPGRRRAGCLVGTIPTECLQPWVHRPLPH